MTEMLVSGSYRLYSGFLARGLCDFMASRKKLQGVLRLRSEVWLFLRVGGPFRAVVGFILGT